jgi:hypothetical protein
MTTSNAERQRPSPLDGWDRLPERVEPLPDQTGLFEYRPRVDQEGQHEFFDTGRDLPGVEETEQRLLWDVED